MAGDVRPSVLERNLIEAAQAYAKANEIPEYIGAGLVLVGVMLGARLPAPMLAQAREEYDRQHPDATRALDLWAVRVRTGTG